MNCSGILIIRYFEHVTRQSSDSIDNNMMIKLVKDLHGVDDHTGLTVYDINWVVGDQSVHPTPDRTAGAGRCGVPRVWRCLQMS